MRVWLWLMKQMVTIAIVCFLTITMTIVVINAFTERIMGSIGLQLDDAKLTYAHVIAHITGQERTIKQGDKQGEPQDGQGLIEQGKHDPTRADVRQGEQPVTAEREVGMTDAEAERAEFETEEEHAEHEAEEESAEPEGEAAIPVWGQQRDDIVFTMEQFNMKREQLSSEDKLTIFAIIVENIPPEEVQVLSTIMEDGITNEELAEIETMLRHYLDDESYEQLMELIVDF